MSWQAWAGLGMSTIVALGMFLLAWKAWASAEKAAKLKVWGVGLETELAKERAARAWFEKRSALLAKRILELKSQKRGRDLEEAGRVKNAADAADFLNESANSVLEAEPDPET